MTAEMHTIVAGGGRHRIAALKNREQLDLWANLSLGFAKKMLEDTGAVEAALLIIGPPTDKEEVQDEDEVNILHINPFLVNDETKDALCAMAPQMLAEFDAYAYILIVESWATSVETGERREVVFAHFETKRDGWTKELDILRDGDTVKGADEWTDYEMPTDAQEGGRMVGWLRGTAEQPAH